jgi:C4-dicarboxylate transporter DctM subunit
VNAYSVFRPVERVIGAVDGWRRRFWRSLADGPLQTLLFLLIILISGAIALTKAALSEADRWWAGIEKGLIGVALLVMTGLSFLDYLRREVPVFDFEIQGGPTMAVVLMVWVGFLGASLATRQRKHLSVDASERLLSPKAARIVKRFSALATAGFCLHFSEYAIDLVDESLVNHAGQDALPLWDWLVPPINLFGEILFGGTPGALGTVAAFGALFAGCAVTRRRWARMRPQDPPTDEDEDPPPPPRRERAVSVVGAIALLGLVLSVFAVMWNPVTPEGDRFKWDQLIQVSAELDAAQADEVAKLDAELDALLFGDAGPATGAKSLTDLKQESTGRQRFPLWLAQLVIPLSFLVMGLRFFGLALFGRFDETRALPEPKNMGTPETLVPPNRKAAKDLIFAGLFPGILIGLCAALGMGIPKLILIAAILLILTGAPLFLAVGVASLACVTLVQDFSGYVVAKDMYEAVKKEELLAIPFFVLAGNVMTQGTIADRLVSLARAVMGRTPGGLGLATILACVVFAAISGSSPVTVIAVGSIMFPMLVKERYPEGYSLGVLTSAGSLGIIIPPSVPMIIYAIMVSSPLSPVSANDLFIAGVLPGLFIASVLVVYTLYQTRPTRPDLKITLPTLEGGYFSNLFREGRRSVFALMLPVMILGGIYGVLGPLRFTVTEAAAVAVVYALFVELFIHREMSLSKLPKVLSDSGVMMGSLFLIIVLAIAFNKFLSEQYIPQHAAAWLQSVVESKWQFIILCNIFLLVLGCVMEIISAILIVAPLLAPIAMQYGMDPIHFGIMFIVNLELGYLTPPMGINLFVSSTVFNRSIVQVIKAVVPFLFMMLFCLFVIAFFEPLSLFLLQ